MSAGSSTPPNDEQLARWEREAEGEYQQTDGYRVIALVAEVRRLRADILAPVQLLFGQPWHTVKEQLPASLVDEMDGWLASKEPDTFPPDGLVEKLYRAYLKAKIEVFPR